jgi:hypothetical protein
MVADGFMPVGSFGPSLSQEGASTDMLIVPLALGADTITFLCPKENCGDV